MLQIWQYFFKLTAQNTQIRHFWSEIFCCCCFAQFFCIWANFRVLMPNISIGFSNSKSKNTQKDIFGLKYKDFYFCMKLFKTFNPKLHKSGILGSKLETFCVARVAFSQVWGHWLQLSEFLKSFKSKNIEKRAFFIPNIKIFIFARNFTFWLIKRCWFQIWQ